MTLLNYIIWNPDPEIFSLGSISVRWYGLLFASSFIASYIVLQKILRKEGEPDDTLDNMLVYTAVGTILGARIGHCLFYEPEYYLSNPLEIIKIWHGGLASHGAGVGILTAIWLFSRQYSKSYLWVLDRLGIVIPLAGAFIRLGNLMNSEIFGNPTDVPWAFKFTMIDNIPRHPTQIYESIACVLLFLFLYYRYKKGDLQITGKIFGLFMFLLFGIRILVEFFKDVQVDFEKTMMLNMGQLLSIPFVMIGLFIYFKSIRKERLKNKS
ncbi:MAG: prolipoprotein diacylglyceryl transferase [Bacteroidetes bacterium GWE2_29_8]|nr:MAG: prolipoprotein diacylglyceryl transferase [Bacteroidetes bacterium GWE2_29_8]OFY15352.1 MAG: prolipoprotein diacylglyceryl transferase [Bacteroidetes bacterium GWF2_29_10]